MRTIRLFLPFIALLQLACGAPGDSIPGEGDGGPGQDPGTGFPEVVFRGDDGPSPADPGSIDADLDLPGLDLPTGPDGAPAEGPSGSDTAGSDMAGSDTSGPGMLPKGPHDLFDDAEIDSLEGLDLEWDQNLSGPDPQGGGKVVRLVFTFTSQVYGGRPWRHEAVLYIPAEPDEMGKRGLVVLQQGEVPGADPGAVFRKLFAIDTVRILGIPVLVVADLPPAELVIQGAGAPDLVAEYPACFDTPLDESTWLRCGIDLVQSSGDFGYSPFAAFTRSFLRAKTAARAVVKLASQILPELPLSGLAFDLVIYGGEGLAGIGARTALAVDGEARGALIAGADVADLPRFAKLQQSAWPDGPWWLAPDLLDALASTPIGRAHARTFDPVHFATDLTGKRLALTIGTLDPRTPLGSLDLYAGKIPAEILPLYIANGTGSKSKGLSDTNHLAVLRVLIDRAARGSQPPKVLAQVEQSGGSILLRATVTGCTALPGGGCTSVQGWLAQFHGKGDDNDYRDTTWSQVPMNPVGSGAYVGVIDGEELPAHSGVFVQVTDVRSAWSRVVSSRLVFLGAPYPFPE